MAKCYQLIGVPGAGKSTWVSNQDWAQDCVYVSSDQFVEKEATRLGKTYNQVFQDYATEAVSLMLDKVILARKAGRDIIWDQTSVSVRSRSRKFEMLPNYDHIAVVFPTPEPEEHARRLDRPGKQVPDEIVQDMIARFEMPTEQEGFKEIWRT
jgi:predicted kinase